MALNPAEARRPAHRPGLPAECVERIVRELGALTPKSPEYRAKRRELAVEFELTENGVEHQRKRAEALADQAPPDAALPGTQARDEVKDSTRRTA